MFNKKYIYYLTKLIKFYCDNYLGKNYFFIILKSINYSGLYSPKDLSE